MFVGFGVTGRCVVAGARRDVLLVDALRPGGAAQRSYVEAVGAAVAALRQCAEHARLAAAPAAAAEAPRAAAADAAAASGVDAGGDGAGPDAYSQSMAARGQQARPASGDAAVNGQVSLWHGGTAILRKQSMLCSVMAFTHF